MQRHSDKSLQLTKKLGVVIRKLRTQKKVSCTKFAYQFDIDKGNLNRIENGLIDCKFTTLWKISVALGVKLTDIIDALEDELGESFSLDDEEE